jgi:hypothetical protein
MNLFSKLFESELWRVCSPAASLPAVWESTAALHLLQASLQAEEKRNGLPCGEASLITKKQDKYLLSLLVVI